MEEEGRGQRTRLEACLYKDREGGNEGLEVEGRRECTNDEMDAEYGWNETMEVVGRDDGQRTRLEVGLRAGAKWRREQEAEGLIDVGVAGNQWERRGAFDPSAKPSTWTSISQRVRGVEAISLTSSM